MQKMVCFGEGAMELCTHEKAVFFLPVNILTVWSPVFLAARHTTVCLDIKAGDTILPTWPFSVHISITHPPPPMVMCSCYRYHREKGAQKRGNINKLLSMD